MAHPAQSPGNFHGYESVTVSTTAVELTDATKASATFATITCEGAIVRFRLDGTAPTASVGHELFAGDILELDSGDQVTKAQFISRDGGSATLRVSYGN